MRLDVRTETGDVNMRQIKGLRIAVNPVNLSFWKLSRKMDCSDARAHTHIDRNATVGHSCRQSAQLMRLQGRIGAKKDRIVVSLRPSSLYH